MLAQNAVFPSFSFQGNGCQAARKEPMLSM